MTELSLFNSLFNDLLGNTSGSLYTTANTPHVDITEEDKAYTLEMELPGRTENDVTTIMSSLGYKNAKVSKYENSVYYKYFVNDDQNNFKNYIEFYFYNSIIKSVTVRASI